MARNLRTLPSLPTTDPDPESDLVALAEHVLLIENAASALAALAPEGCVVMANRALRALLLYEADDLIRRPVAELTDACADCSAATWEDEMAERPVHLRRGDGSWLDARVSTVVVRDDKEQPTYLLCLVRPA